MNGDLELKLSDFKPAFGFIDYTRRFVDSGENESKEILRRRDLLIAYNVGVVVSVSFGISAYMLGC